MLDTCIDRHDRLRGNALTFSDSISSQSSCLHLYARDRMELLRKIHRPLLLYVYNTL